MKFVLRFALILLIINYLSSPMLLGCGPIFNGPQPVRKITIALIIITAGSLLWKFRNIPTDFIQNLLGFSYEQSQAIAFENNPTPPRKTTRSAPDIQI